MAQPATGPLACSLILESNYLHFPAKQGAPQCLVSIRAAGALVREFVIELAPSWEAADFWVFTDVRRFTGQTALVTFEWADGGPPPVQAPPPVRQSDDFPDAGELYRERLRPQFHFSARRGWINDPNGLLYYSGTYHLFFQHNPYGTRHGNMHWGHAVSSDLVHWTELDEALYPDEAGTVFSGSGVVDSRNTSGLKVGEEPPLVLVYTAAGGTSRQSRGRPFTQCIAYSTDGGKTWAKYDGNPVVGHIAGANRDPKVIWHEPTGKWVMALYLEGNKFAFLSSPDLKRWEYLSDIEIPGCAECPDFFPLPLDGDPDRTKWVLWGANGSYLVGEFDGARFVPEATVLDRSNEKASWYAAQTWSNIPPEDGRVIQIAWFQCNLPGMPFNHFMTFPCELSLRSTQEGPRLFRRPVREIKKLYRKEVRRGGERLVPGEPVVLELDDDLLDIDLVLRLETAEEVEIAAGKAVVRYSAAQRELWCNGKTCALSPEAGEVRLRLLVDRASVDVFGNEGRVYMPAAAVRDGSGRRLILAATGGAATVAPLVVNVLRSIWT